MRGKFAPLEEPQRIVLDASMRPAHYAREVQLQVRRRHVDGRASMRPAHYAREVRDALESLLGGARLLQ